MSDILERAKEHFKNRLAGEMEYIDVPEWGKEIDGKVIPQRIYWKPLTLREQNAVLKYVNEGSIEAIVSMIIQRARDADEKKLFKPMHMSEFMRHVDPKIVERISNAMAGEDEDEDEGKDKDDPAKN